MQVEALVSMINQIASFFAHEGEAQAASSIADHLRKYWDPRMRKAIVAHVEAGGAGLAPAALQAVASL
ncbi:MAG: formate dehydrogenase subunit delta [Pseudomonadales bacterium]|nr:formate dehydrogenase subunit delta [Pseudomonadales bacterium]